MATIDSFDSGKPLPAGFGPAKPASSPVSTSGSDVMFVLNAIASLRLTVVLLGLLLFLIFAGTIAQVEHGIWDVVNEQYFRVWMAKVEVQAFCDLVDKFRPAEDRMNVQSGVFIPFPGGYTIGFLMAINLLAAHILRFRVRASGERLVAGVLISAIGALGLGWIATEWLDDTGIDTLSPRFADNVWLGVKSIVILAATACAMWLVMSWEKLRRTDWFVLFGANLLLLVVACWLWLGDWQIPIEAMRIVWILGQGTFAGAILLAGCYLVFDNRAGIVLLHAGVLVLMAHEFYTGQFAGESQMYIEEGATSNFSIDNRYAELVLVDRSGEKDDEYIVIGGDLLARYAKSGETIRDAQLPVDIRVVDYLENSTLAVAEEENPATRGAGLGIKASEVDGTSGMATNSIDIPSTYVEILDKESGESLGVFLLSVLFNERFTGPKSRLADFEWQPIDVGDSQYDLGLRFEHHYRPYSLTLIDFRFDRYPGTNKPRNYSSEIVINDPGQPARTVTISMNNPLRYMGETYYQQGFDEITEKATILQVAKNEGYMLPYLSCALVFLGMLWHFGVKLGQFMLRRGRSQSAVANQGSADEFSPINLVAPLVAAAVTILVFGMAMMPQRDKQGEMQLEAFAALPVLDDGRVKPIDTLARTTLQYITARQEAPTRVPTSDNKSQEKISATQWMLDVLSGNQAAIDYPIFRIENLEVLEELGLEPRPGFYRYSYRELEENYAEFMPLVSEAAEKSSREEDLTTFEGKVLEISGKRNEFVALANAFQVPRFDERDDPRAAIDRILRTAQQLRSGAPRAVPPVEGDGEWATYFEARLKDMFAANTGDTVNPATKAWTDLMVAYQGGDVANFNASVTKLQQLAIDYEDELNSPKHAKTLASLKPSQTLRTDVIGVEKWLNSAELFYIAAVMYLLAFVITCVSWLTLPRTIGSIALAVIVVTLLVHTFAIWQRTVISGRPPITNLYDTTICVGWACVLLGVVLEVIYRIGLGSGVASLVGFMTLLVGHFLSLDGDTFTVLQAVLDTNFWLATHVISINLGYATTVLAGTFGIAWIVLYQLLGILGKEEEKQLSRMLYGSVCFAILFSFVGTVLGGLWADDSWGRFWGWDPKENGALMVVLWNAVLLHARWGGMVAHRGMAQLAVAGNIITAWSWFGTNGLGIGLHSYGFTEGTAMALVAFWLVNLVIIGASFLPIDRVVSDEEPMPT